MIRHYGRNVIVVMDGYGNENCTKTSTRKVRASKYAAKEITFDLSMKAVSEQGEFLGSKSNKARFISKLTGFLEDEDIHVKQAAGDADFLIISTALEAAAQTTDPVVVVGNDTDLQCMLVERCENSNVYIQLDTGDPSEIYNVRDAQKNVTAAQRNVLTVVHCLTS